MKLKTTTINGVEIPLEEVCEECEGDGFTAEHDPFDPHEGGICSSCPIQVQCEACKGTGKQPIYYTPQQIEELTGENLPWHYTVWWLNQGHQRYEHRYLSEVYPEDINCEIVLVRVKTQPAPPADYRVKE